MPTEIPAAEWLDPHELKPLPNNPRINDHAVEKVAASIERFGFGSPIVATVDGKWIIAGHTRQKAAFKLEMDLVPVRLLDISKDEAMKLNIADNKLTEVAFWDYEALQEMLADIKEESPEDLDLLGWSDSELKNILYSEWKPPSVTDEQFKGGGGSHTITMSEEDYQKIQQAVALVRTKDGSLSVGKCLVQICAEYQG